MESEVQSPARAIGCALACASRGSTGAKVGSKSVLLNAVSVPAWRIVAGETCHSFCQAGRTRPFSMQCLQVCVRAQQVQERSQWRAYFYEFLVIQILLQQILQVQPVQGCTCTASLFYFHAFKFLIKCLIPSRWRFACRAYQEPWKVQNVCGMGCPSFFSVDCGDFWQDAWFSAKDLRSPWFISSSTPFYSLWCATGLLQLELRTFGVSKIVALRTNVAAILCFNPPMCGCERTGGNPACVGRAARPKACLLSQRCAEWAMVLVAPVCGISTAQLPADCTARRWSQVSGDSK